MLAWLMHPVGVEVKTVLKQVVNEEVLVNLNQVVCEAQCTGGMVPLPSRTDSQLPNSSFVQGAGVLLSHTGGRRQDSMTALACKELLLCYVSTLFVPSKLVRYLFYSGGYSMSLHWHALATFLHTCFHPSCTV